MRSRRAHQRAHCPPAASTAEQVRQHRAETPETSAQLSPRPPSRPGAGRRPRSCRTPPPRGRSAGRAGSRSCAPGSGPNGGSQPSVPAARRRGCHGRAAAGRSFLEPPAYPLGRGWLRLREAARRRRRQRPGPAEPGRGGRE